RARKRWVTVLVAVAAPLIASSRIYLGVHYPHDALAGLVLGLLWASAFVWLDRATETQRRRFAAPALLGLVVVVSAALALTLSASYAHLAAAAWLGAGLGYAAERFWVGLGPAPCHRTGWRRLAVGLVLLACLGGLAAVPGAVTAIKEQRLLGSIAAFVLCLVPTVLAPWLFASLGLVETVSRDGLVRRR
ncbi:MAG: phosphatase PAP2 family protein, partial [Chloroflexi bacterium]|nr:phosphatase PAP2 family protein [Chloroflexota bacterium]